MLSSRASLPGTLTLDAATVTSILGMLQGTRISDDAWVHDVRIEEDETGIDITVSVGTEELPGMPVGAVKENLAARLAARPDAVVRVALDQPPIRQVVARIADVPVSYTHLDVYKRQRLHRIEGDSRPGGPGRSHPPWVGAGGAGWSTWFGPSGVPYRPPPTESTRSRWAGTSPRCHANAPGTRM